MSNIATHWPLQEQERLLSERLPDWQTVALYRDTLPAAKRKAHNRASLEDRARLLRPTGRAVNGEKIYVASLACLAWSSDDLSAVLTSASARGATIIALDSGVSVGPDATAKVLHDAIVAFAEAKKKTTGRGPLAGALISAERRSAAAREAAMSIQAEWALPTRDYPTDSLLDRAGISRNTANLYLGHRPLAQKIHRDKMKRRAARKRAQKP